jgi:DNA-binding HxlR family transcriptional regulator
MKRRNFAHRPGCAVEATLDLIDGKWKGVILFHLQAAAPSGLGSCGGGCRELPSACRPT